jgi:tRNA dimethylallyltransferase
MSALGYAQVAAHLLDGVPLETAVTATRRATRDFIRRQLTWFRGHDSGIVWHNRDSVDTAALIASIRAWVENRE